MKCFNDEKVYIAWRRRLRIRFAWIGIVISLVALVVIGIWVHLHPVYESTVEIDTSKSPQWKLLEAQEKFERERIEKGIYDY